MTAVESPNQTPRSIADQLSDSEFIYSFIEEYLADNLTDSQKTRFQALLEKFPRISEEFSESRGHLQAAFSSWQLDDQQQQQLRRLVEDDVSRADHEADNIKVIGQTQFRGNLTRALVLAATLIGLVSVGYYYLGPVSKPDFGALESLTYEAEKFTRGEPLDLPSEDLNEVREFVFKYPNLGFKPLPFYSLKSENWLLEGGSVIAYDHIKIPMVQYSSFSDHDLKMFLFQYKGHLEDLPASTAGTSKTMSYQTYTDDKVNIVAWQAHEDIVGMIIGTSGGEDLAKLGRLGLKLVP